jgi:hypothetical protein
MKIYIRNVYKEKHNADGVERPEDCVLSRLFLIILLI